MTETQPAAPPPKSILASKTFWLQLIAIASVFYPPVGVFVAANPVAATAVFAAANVIVRFATNGQVNIFGDNTTPPVGKLLAFLVLGTMAVLMGLGLPSCSPEQLAAARAVPIHATWHSQGGTVFYDSKSGLEVSYPDTSSGK